MVRKSHFIIEPTPPCMEDRVIYLMELWRAGAPIMGHRTILLALIVIDVHCQRPPGHPKLSGVDPRKIEGLVMTGD